MHESQGSSNEVLEDPKMTEEFQATKSKKGKGKVVEVVQGTRKSSKLEANDDIKITKKAISRAEARDALVNKGMNHNPFSVLNFDDGTLIEIVGKINVNLGSTNSEIVESLNYIKSLERNRSFMIQHHASMDIEKQKPILCTGK